MTEKPPDAGAMTADIPLSAEAKGDWLWLVVTLALTAAAFLPHLGGEFLRNWDDGIFILENRRLEFTAENVWRYASRSYRQLYTPLPMYSLMLDKALFGLSPLPFKLHNLLLHCGGAGLLYLIFRRLRFSPLISTLGVLLWSIHPQRNESVLWIVERKDVLCGLLSFGAFLTFLRALEEKGYRWGFFCALLTVLALGCKPAAAPLPGVYLVYALMTGRWRWRVLFPVTAGLAAVFLSGLLTARNNPGAFQSIWLVPLHNLFWYPLTAVIPWFATCPIYPQVKTFLSHLPVFLAGFVLFAGASYYALMIRKVRLALFTGVLLIAGGMLLPALGLWQYTEFHYCDRYNYLAAPAVIIPLLWLFRDRRWSPVLLSATALLMLFATWRSGSVWHSDRTLWRACLEVAIPNPKAFQVASGDSLMREDPEDLAYIARRLMEVKGAIPLPEDKVENTSILLQAHSFIIREEYGKGLPLLAELLRREEASGKELRFMRGSNYRYIFDENAPMAKFYLRRKSRSNDDSR